MSDRLITAEEARDMLENKVTPYPYTGDPLSGFKDANGELVVWEDDITGDTCTTPQFISGALIAPRLMETIIAQESRLDDQADTMRSLIRERDEWEGNAEEQAGIVERQAGQIERLQQAVEHALHFSTETLEELITNGWIKAEDMEEK